MEIQILSRELAPFEHLVAQHLCDGLSNSAVARRTAQSEKVIENTVSRMARAFNIESDGATNIRVSLALAYRMHFGGGSFDKLVLPCPHLQVTAGNRLICNLYQ